MPSGGARKNAGRKSLKELALDRQAAIDNLSGWFTPALQKSKWTALLNSDDESAQVKAMTYLSDRLYGKAAQSMKIEGEMAIEVIKRVVSDL